MRGLLAISHQLPLCVPEEHIPASVTRDIFQWQKPDLCFPTSHSPGKQPQFFYWATQGCLSLVSPWNSKQSGEKLIVTDKGNKGRAWTEQMGHLSRGQVIQQQDKGLVVQISAPPLSVR